MYTEKVRSLFGNQEQVTNYKQFWKFIEGDLVDGTLCAIPEIYHTLHFAIKNQVISKISFISLKIKIFQKCFESCVGR